MPLEKTQGREQGKELTRWAKVKLLPDQDERSVERRLCSKRRHMQRSIQNIPNFSVVLQGGPWTVAPLFIIMTHIQNRSFQDSCDSISMHCNCC